MICKPNSNKKIKNGQIYIQNYTNLYTQEIEIKKHKYIQQHIQVK